MFREKASRACHSPPVKIFFFFFFFFPDFGFIEVLQSMFWALCVLRLGRAICGFAVEVRPPLRHICMIGMAQDPNITTIAPGGHCECCSVTHLQPRTWR